MMTAELKSKRLHVPAALALAAAAMLYAAAPVAQDRTGDVGRGAQSWSDNCARCHNMRDPTEFRDDLWRPIIGHMRIRAGLSGQQARDVLAFMQSSNFKVAARTASPQVAAAVDPAAAYNQTCVACHGADGKGTVPGAPDFTAPSGTLGKTDDVLLQHMIEGFQSPGSPMAMPARGGNPVLTDADLAAVLAWLRDRFGAR